VDVSNSLHNGYLVGKFYFATIENMRDSETQEFRSCFCKDVTCTVLSTRV
jgi:hypothetical protein